MLDSEKLQAVVIDALEDVKATDIRVLDVQDKTSFTDVLVIASGNSPRQVKSLANSVVVKAKEAGVTPVGMEGVQQGEWALIDLGDVVVHIMQPSIRDFYNLEKLWGDDSPQAAQDKKA